MTLDEKIGRYLPCVHCCAFYMKHDLWRHAQHCRFKEGTSNINVVGRASIMLQGATNKTFKVNGPFEQQVLQSMRQDEIMQTVLNDDVIIKYGRNLHQRLGRNRAHDISQRMRQLARLILRVNTMIENRQCKVSLCQCLSGVYFDTVVEATRSLCTPHEASENRPLFRNPSIGLKLGHALIKRAELKKGIGIRNDDET